MSSFNWTGGESKSSLTLLTGLVVGLLLGSSTLLLMGDLDLALGDLDLALGDLDLALALANSANLCSSSRTRLDKSTRASLGLADPADTAAAAGGELSSSASKAELTVG